MKCVKMKFFAKKKKYFFCKTEKYKVSAAKHFKKKIGTYYKKVHWRIILIMKIELYNIKPKVILAESKVSGIKAGRTKLVGI